MNTSSHSFAQSYWRDTYKYDVVQTAMYYFKPMTVLSATLASIQQNVAGMYVNVQYIEIHEVKEPYYFPIIDWIPPKGLSIESIAP